MTDRTKPLPAPQDHEWRVRESDGLRGVFYLGLYYDMARADDDGSHAEGEARFTNINQIQRASKRVLRKFERERAADEYAARVRKAVQSA